MKQNLLFFILAITFLSRAQAFTTIFEVNVQCTTGVKIPQGWKSNVEYISDPTIKKSCTFLYSGAADVVKGVAAEAIKREMGSVTVAPAGSTGPGFEYKIISLTNNENIHAAEKDGWKSVGNKFKLGNYKTCNVLIRSSRSLKEIKAVANAIILAVTTTDLEL